MTMTTGLVNIHFKEHFSVHRQMLFSIKWWRRYRALSSLSTVVSSAFTSDIFLCLSFHLSLSLSILSHLTVSDSYKTILRFANDVKFYSDLLYTAFFQMEIRFLKQFTIIRKFVCRWSYNSEACSCICLSLSHTCPGTYLHPEMARLLSQSWSDRKYTQKLFPSLQCANLSIFRAKPRRGKPTENYAIRFIQASGVPALCLNYTQIFSS